MEQEEEGILPHGCNIQEHRLRRSIECEAGKAGLHHEHGGLHGFPFQGQSVKGCLIGCVVEHLSAKPWVVAGKQVCCLATPSL